MKKAIFIKVDGDVQGVFYRYHAEKKAAKLGASGWVKNEHDGTVTILVQGDEAKVAQMIDWARIGSPLAKVDKIETQEVEYDPKMKGFSGK